MTAPRCNKHRWPDEISARAGALISLEQRPHMRMLSIYQCPDCSGWHLTRNQQHDVERRMIRDIKLEQLWDQAATVAKERAARKTARMLRVMRSRAR